MASVSELQQLAIGLRNDPRWVSFVEGTAQGLVIRRNLDPDVAVKSAIELCQLLRKVMHEPMDLKKE